MEILNSGSFVILENQEKIEQLKYTANELANAAIGTAGFVNEEEPARKLAHEFWQGLEYMCRENEQTAIQNIFTGEFLDRLRELRPAATISNIAPTDEKQEFVQESEVQIVSVEDEFLGVLAPENQATDVVKNTDESQEITNLTEDFVGKIEIEAAEPVESESDSTQSEEDVSQTTEASLTDAEAETKEVEVSDGLSLPEKEPYQFNKCTVTATIQLLPVGENADFRKAVLSVRTHDFAPQISMVEISGSNLTLALAPEIEKVLANYQADLPFKVMDKMKKEKNSAKKSAPKNVTETKTVSQPSPNTKEIPSVQNSQTASAEISSPVIAPPTVETAAQGSLF
jgi:hypothetical protein